MSEWQPFHTAPEDGTVILAFRKDQGAFTAHFISPSDALGYPVDDTAQWWSTDGGDITGSLMPTHWMPIPKAPA